MPYYLLYDSDCSLCVRFQEWIQKRDTQGVVEPVPFKDPRISQIVPQMNRDQLLNSFHLVLPDGSVLSGHRAIPELLMLLPGLRTAGWILRYTPFGQKLSERVYLWIAAHRK